MYRVKKSVLKKIGVFLLVLLTACGAPNTDKSFEYNWSAGGKTTCTPLYNEDGSFAQSSCKTYCTNSVEVTNGKFLWVPFTESEKGRFFEVLLPIENAAQFKEYMKSKTGNSQLAFCSVPVELDNGLRCLGYGKNVDDPNSNFLLQQCSYICPSGIPRNVIVGNAENDYVDYSSELSKIEKSELEKDNCAAVSPPLEAPTDVIVEALTEAPAEAVTEAPTEAPPAELPTPILTGDVTYCDIVSRSVNLRLVEGFSAEEFSHQVTIGGEAMSCKVNEGNATLLTCTFPATTKFPAAIQVSKDGNVVNEFEYNGSNCVVPEQQAGPKDPGSGEESSSGSDCWDLYVPFGLCIPKP